MFIALRQMKLTKTKVNRKPQRPFFSLFIPNNNENYIITRKGCCSFNCFLFLEITLELLKTTKRSIVLLNLHV